MDWAVFFMALIEAIADCIEQRRRDSVERELQNPGIRSRRVATRLLRQQGFHGRELREEVDEAIEYLREQDAEDISLLLDSAEEDLQRLARNPASTRPQGQPPADIAKALEEGRLP